MTQQILYLNQESIIPFFNPKGVDDRRGEEHPNQYLKDRIIIPRPYVDNLNKLGVDKNMIIGMQFTTTDRLRFFNNDIKVIRSYNLNKYDDLSYILSIDKTTTEIQY